MNSIIEVCLVFADWYGIHFVVFAVKFMRSLIVMLLRAVVPAVSSASADSSRIVCYIIAGTCAKPLVRWWSHRPRWKSQSGRGFCLPAMWVLHASTKFDHLATFCSKVDDLIARLTTSVQPDFCVRLIEPESQRPFLNSLWTRLSAGVREAYGQSKIDKPKLMNENVKSRMMGCIACGGWGGYALGVRDTCDIAAYRDPGPPMTLYSHLSPFAR